MPAESSNAPRPNMTVTRARSPSRVHSRAAWTSRRCSGHKLVAHPPYRQDVAGQGGGGLDLRPEPADVDVDEPPVTEIVVAPHTVEQLFAAEDLVRAGGELAQQTELRLGAVHLRAVLVAEDPLFGQKLEVAEDEDRRLVVGRADPPEQGADPCAELLGDEGLR